MNLKDLKIGTQMKMGFGIIVILIVGLGAIAWYQTDKIAQHTLDMYTHPFTVRKALGSLNADVLTMQLELRNVMLAQHDSDKQEALINSKIHETDAVKQFQILSERYLGPPEDVVNARESFTRWVELRSNHSELINSGKISEAMIHLDNNGDIGREREHLLKCIHTIDTFAGNKGTEFFLGTTTLKNLLNRQLGILLIVVLSLTVIIVYFLNKNINIPISELASVTRQFKDGNFKVRSRYQSKNEFGQLSSSFNNLAETIETELMLNNQASSLAGVMLKEDDAHLFCRALLSSLLEYLEAQLGAVYLLNEEKTTYYHFESVGMEADASRTFSAVHYEGEFGEALATRQIQHIVAVPDDTPFMFSMVSGKFRPREIITIPIVSGNETVAVISLATVKSFNENHLRLLHIILSTLSARVDGILAYQKVIEFAKKLEVQNNELEMQKKELSMQTHELTGQNIELEIQKKQLGEANRMKTSFLSNMSHELRTPLNSVIALSGVLSRRLIGKVPEEEHGYLSVIERNGKQLLLLINDILDLSRIESGFDEVEIRKININEVIQSVVEMIEPQAKEKAIYVRFLAHDNIPTFNSDYDKCYHILQNLISNAIKFTEVGGVEINTELNNKTVHIIVKDTGIGIEGEHLPHIFDEFRQADSSSSRKYGGTGLGLAIAKKYANLLNGNIIVESTPGVGSSFTLVLPLDLESRDITDKKQVKTSSVGSLEPVQIKGQAKDKTILLVEDAEAIIVQMKDMLAAQGYNIMIAHNGVEAIDQITRKVPDAMILDLMMPGADGFEVLRRIREVEKTQHIPVIILTAKYVTKQEIEFLNNNGIHQLIQKGDINKDQLLDAVNSMVAQEVKQTVTPLENQPRKISPHTAVILVVEDNPDNMLTLRVLLEGKYRIIEAMEGITAIKLAQIHLPDLILMDIALPGMNGIETMAEIRKREALRHIPVIAVSASAMKGDREDFIASGFNDYVSKPVDNLLLEKTIKRYLE